MVPQVNAIHFEISDRLSQFIQKKTDKLCRKYDRITGIEVNLRVVKPETAKNKEAAITVMVPSCPDQFASKIADTFEEAIDQCLDAIERQLERIKEKNNPNS